MSEVENKAVEVKPAVTSAPVSKIDAAMQKVQAEAATKADVAPAAKTTAAPKKAPVAQKVPLVRKAAAKTVRKAATKKTAAKSTPVNKPVQAKKAAKATAAPKTNPVTKLKDTIMATAKNTDIAATAKEMLADVQTRAKTAAAKSTVLANEATEFSKANVEAVVESGKIFFAGAQELLKDNVETGKTVIETVTEDAKKVAAVKSPTELMQLQGEIARRNFDALVSYGSKRTEAWVKLYNEAFAPISNRVSVAAEKISKAA